ncbi:MAG TPA: polysaccharide pyruvyl transferase family protein [Caulobacteraceae bacterium]|jgi:hypothetical protein|nr:polysaccharide pyruvyl transferase family protein [Caulobacteraceae bacterium]
MPDRRTIGVLTFHRCINYGSYWQARCLTEGLRRRGWNAILLDHRSRRVDRAEWACAMRPRLPVRPSRAEIRAYAAKVRRFEAAIASLPLSAPFSLEQPEAMEACGIGMVGSDEVWNFSHPWYAACPLFFGDGLKGDRLVAYAASFGNYDASAGLEPGWARRLARFSAIAVRDENSRRLVRDGVGREPALVLDPCLLFADICRGAPDGAGAEYALVYGHSFGDDFAAAAQGWSRANGMRLVSVGYQNDWADEQRLSAGPAEFADAMAGAAAVITNFFHGCVFALVNQKPFACAISDYRANKVTALLEALGAHERLVAAADAADALQANLSAAPGVAVAERLSRLRRSSEAYLERALA